MDGALVPLGSSGLSVSRLGLGLAALGRPGYINLGHADDLAGDYDVDVMERRAHDVLDFAWRSGVRYFDTARSYGRGEDFLGSWLRERRIEPPAATVGSKWGYVYTAGWRTSAEKHEVKQHVLPVLERQIEESRERLGSYLDLYQIHSATLDSGVLDRPDVLDELARLRDGGLLIGLSLSGPGQAATLEKALTLRRGAAPLFGCVQATWNVLEPSAGEALAAAHAQGLGVIVKEVLANGQLTARGRGDELEPKLAVLRQVADSHGVGVDAVALAAALSQPWVDVALSGAAGVDQLASNLLALDVDLQGRPFDELAEPAERYWSRRASLEWN